MTADAQFAVPTPKDETAAAYRTRGVTRVYHMGEVEVHALRGVDMDL